MAEQRIREGYELVHPNRDKASSKVTKLIVVLLLLASVGLMLVVTFGGWKALAGQKPLLIGFEAVFVIMAFFCARWTRGVLPLSAALGIILLIFAAVSAPAWFARDRTGFTDPDLSSSFLGLINLVLIPVEFLLIAFSMRAFQQNWHVEVEQRIDDRRTRDDGRTRDGEPQGAAA